MLHRMCLIAPLVMTLVACSAVGVFAQAPGAANNVGAAANALEQSAFFSDECRQAAMELPIPSLLDEHDLLTAFAAHVAAAPAEARAEWSADFGLDQAARIGCALPAVGLVNLLRLNGIDAELVFAAVPAEPPAETRDVIVVYVPAVDRYVDPAAASPVIDLAFDRMLHTATRTLHIASVSVSPAGDRTGCRDLCMRIINPIHPDAVRVRTEVIRQP